MPVPRERVRGVLLFGGTFDPPHRAHIELARSVRDRLGGRGWWMVYVPAARSPHKDAAPRASDAERLEMLRLATRGVPRCAIWTDEIDRAGRSRASYWIETLARARRTLPPGLPLRFLIGSDQASAFHRWKDPRGILECAEPIVMLRPPHRSAAGLLRSLRAPRFWTREELALWSSAIDDHALMEHAATDVRAALAEGDFARARPLLSPRVLRFVRAHAIYAAPTTDRGATPGTARGPRRRSFVARSAASPRRSA